ncbi:response regulator transcription factor [Actinokineospora fastidiosa]|uniref:Two-component system response regulator, LuxR family protein n=1 Tax=Actinokineospora fastidiosa TaxID=1816 RepID=A0A918LIW9_9PSEU|nr:response regulator transcription factor [Actinokineospora fastidiosa]GGS54092.1 putative two-component system response regulator, LuxR family protein [Actinokineospora fastidiosa]
MRVAVADDIPLFREGLVLLLERFGIEVVAQASDGDEILQKVRDHHPSTVILDVMMPPGEYGGLTAAERLHAEDPDIGLLLLSGFNSTRFALHLLACDGRGGRGYLIKDRVTDPAVLRDVLKAVNDGGVSVDSEIVKRVMNPKYRQGILSALTSRELEILNLVAQGLSNKGIAKRFGLSGKTVDRHVSNICDKLGICDDEQSTRRSIILLKYFQANHICDARCSSPCTFATAMA